MWRRGIFTAPALVLAVYILLLCSRFLDTSLFADSNGYLTVVVMQLLIFLLPAAIYCKLRGDHIRGRLRIRLVGLEQLLLVLAAALTLICGAMVISFAMGGDQNDLRYSLYEQFAAMTDGGAGNLLYALMAFAVLPAICEEFVFRGVLCAELERNGLPAAVLISALFFAMLHFDLPRFPIYLFAGIVLAMVLYATRSVLGPIVVHFLYNLFGLFGRPYMTELYERTGSASLFIFLLAVLFLLALILFFGEAARSYSGYARRGLRADDYRPNIPRMKGSSPFAEALLTPLGLLAALFYVIVIIAV